MRITEISRKDQFVAGLKDPATKELFDIIKSIRGRNRGQGWEISYKIYKQHPTAKIVAFKPDAEFVEATRVENNVYLTFLNSEHWSLESYDSDMNGITFQLVKR